MLACWSNSLYDFKADIADIIVKFYTGNLN